MSNFNFDEIEFSDNPDPRLPVLLVLDSSDSMTQKFPDEERSPMEALNAGLDVLISQLYKDPLAKRRAEVSVISYGSKVNDPTPFATVENLQIPILEGSGLTSTGAALNTAMDVLEERKNTYKNNGVQYYRPLLLLISDGLSTDSLDEASKRLKEYTETKKLTFMPIGVEGADLDQLTSITGKRALMLKELAFEELFQWLSASISSVSASQVGDAVKAPPVDDWAEL